MSQDAQRSDSRPPPSGVTLDCDSPVAAAVSGSVPTAEYAVSTVVKFSEQEAPLWRGIAEPFRLFPSPVQEPSIRSHA